MNEFGVCNKIRIKTPHLCFAYLCLCLCLCLCLIWRHTHTVPHTIGWNVAHLCGNIVCWSSGDFWSIGRGNQYIQERGRFSRGKEIGASRKTVTAQLCFAHLVGLKHRSRNAGPRLRLSAHCTFWPFPSHPEVLCLPQYRLLLIVVRLLNMTCVLLCGCICIELRQCKPRAYLLSHFTFDSWCLVSGVAAPYALVHAISHTPTKDTEKQLKP